MGDKIEDNYDFWDFVETEILNNYLSKETKVKDDSSKIE